MDRAACFIDGGYFQNILKSFGEPRVDFSKLVEFMRKGNPLLRAYYYNCHRLIREGHEEEDRAYQVKQNGFFHSLSMIPQFECKFGKLKQYTNQFGKDEFVQKQVDVLMAIDVVTLSAKKLINHAKIIAGDSDLIPAVQVAKNEGVVVELFYLYGTADVELLKTVDIATAIDYDMIDMVRID